MKKYGDFTAVNGISLNIEQGEFFTLLGPSGCGKATLLRMIAGFNTVDGGEICFDEQVINNLPAHKRDIGMVFQNYAIFPHLNVADNAAYGLKARKVPKAEIVRLAEWDTMASKVFAEQVMKYIRACDADNLPKKSLLAF